MKTATVAGIEFTADGDVVRYHPFSKIDWFSVPNEQTILRIKPAFDGADTLMIDTFFNTYGLEQVGQGPEGWRLVHHSRRYEK